jgi:hypothetical protein
MMSLRITWVVGLGFVAGSCGAQRGAVVTALTPAEAAASAWPGQQPTVTAAPEPAEPSPSASPAAAPSAKAPVGPPRSASFPPPDVSPPYARSAAPDDGTWRAFGDAKGSDGKPLLVATELHPHEASKFITLSVVAVDLARIRLDFLPGVDDVGKVEVPFVPGVVPNAVQGSLVAVFNGGFMPRHGRWGMRVGDVTLLPPREPGCTVAIDAQDAVHIRSWPALAARAGELRVIRQTPPCLLEQGSLNPELIAGRERAWAGQTPGVVTRRRSALGLSEDRQTLFYAIGVEATPRLLASGLAAVGAHDAAQLDINWNWTRFLLYEPNAEGKPRVTTTLAEVEHTRRDYIDAPSKRDFFFLVRR